MRRHRRRQHLAADSSLRRSGIVDWPAGAAVSRRRCLVCAHAAVALARPNNSRSGIRIRRRVIGSLYCRKRSMELARRTSVPIAIAYLPQYPRVLCSGRIKTNLPAHALQGAAPTTHAALEYGCRRNQKFSFRPMAGRSRPPSHVGIRCDAGVRFVVQIDKRRAHGGERRRLAAVQLAVSTAAPGYGTPSGRVPSAVDVAALFSRKYLQLADALRDLLYTVSPFTAPTTFPARRPGLACCVGCIPRMQRRLFALVQRNDRAIRGS